MSDELRPLEKTLRKALETAVKKARDEAEEAADAALDQLEVGAAKTESLDKESDKELRRRLRIHGRQLGDKRNKQTEVQEVDRLREEIAYQHWHRMLFARFLAENRLLMYPDPVDPVALKLSDCEDLVAENVEDLLPDLFPNAPKNGWEVAAKFAAQMLPQIFRVDSPVFEVTLPTEKQQKLEKILSDLPTEIFTASDSLGWVYQFWQAKRKDEVNASEVKIGARELPAVTQLFTEPYMVSFLLDNSLGAWWAARRLTEDDLRTAETEQELREKAALPGVPLEYLRFVRTPSDDVSGKALADGSSDEGEENTGPWTPAAGTFDAWPESLSELKTLDPCCGSGHFLVAALLMLTPMRMELEGLSATEAVDRVLSENLHGLEIDQRCVELAAFALALAAWRFPSGDAAGGYRVLPDLNVACCGLSVSVAKEEWKELARGNNQLKIALDWMYDEFKDAPVLGSLLNPAKSMAAGVVSWDKLAPIIESALASESDDVREAAVVAHGLAEASLLLARKYNLVVTNVPYLSSNKQHEVMRTWIEEHETDGKADLATAFLSRWIGSCQPGGALCTVTPQNWLFLSSYKALRKSLLKNAKWCYAAKLGPNAFQDMNYWAATTSLTIIGNEQPIPLHNMSVIDVSDDKQQEVKASMLKGQTDCPFFSIPQAAQLDAPDSRILFDRAAISSLEKLSVYAIPKTGLQTGDNDKYAMKFWEFPSIGVPWVPFQRTAEVTCHHSGQIQLLRWESNGEEIASQPSSRVQGLDCRGQAGVLVHRMNKLQSTIYSKHIFDQNGAVLLAKNSSDLLAMWCYVSSQEYHDAVRLLDEKVGVTPATLAKVPFDLAHWQEVASEKYPHGLPEPYSDDPTQWIFHGHPASSTDALQVAVARLLGYRWPAELDGEMELATDAREWVERSSQLYDSSENDLVDKDGIVCLPAIGSEKAAHERLLNVLNQAYQDAVAQEKDFSDRLAANDLEDSITVDLLRRGWQPSLPSSFNSWIASLLEQASHKGKPLESWLRDKFFTQHCKLFHHRPFIWHIWDGEKDGFSALVNYHKLDDKLLGKLIHNHLNKWIRKQEQSSEDGHEQRLAAAKGLKLKLEKILEGESPHDIFVRWKPLSEQPIGWNPDLNDGVRLNIRPWMTVGDVGKKDAGVLRDKPNCKWNKDRGKDVESAPWYHLGPEYGGKEGDRINDHHLELADKQAAQNEP